MAFVVIQHRSPDFRSVMDELIARRCEMPVRLVEDGELVEPNRVYLNPGQGLSLPIDQFFRSLAQDLGPQAVAVVPSGIADVGAYAEQLRTDPGELNSLYQDLEDVLLVALTGYGAPADIAAARQAGFDDHLIKPRRATQDRADPGPEKAMLTGSASCR